MSINNALYFKIAKQIKGGIKRTKNKVSNSFTSCRNCQKVVEKISIFKNVLRQEQFQNSSTKKQES